MKLSIAEGFYLIALDDEEGRILASAEKTVVKGVVSACILELYMHNKVDIESEKINVLDKTATGNIILDNVLKNIDSGNPFLEEIESISKKIKDIHTDLNVLLQQRGILKKTETKLLWIPLSERMDNKNYAFEEDIRNRIRVIVLKNAKASTPFVILFILIKYNNILEEVFPDKDELIDAEKVAKDIIKNSDIDEKIAKFLLDIKKIFQ